MKGNRVKANVQMRLDENAAGLTDQNKAAPSIACQAGSRRVVSSVRPGISQHSPLTEAEMCAAWSGAAGASRISCVEPGGGPVRAS